MKINTTSAKTTDFDVLMTATDKIQNCFFNMSIDYKAFNLVKMIAKNEEEMIP